MNVRTALLRTALRVTGRGKLTILIYHRVLPDRDPIFPSTVDARRFDEQMSWLKAWLRILPLGEAIDMLRVARLPAGAACITFDDGYADNAEIALPILARHAIPATFFIATGYLDGGRMWNDTVIEAVRRAEGSRVDLRSLGLGEHAIDSPRARRATMQGIIEALKYRAPAERLALVEKIASTLGNELPRDLMMTSEAVRRLHRAGMAIGAHTVTHPILTRVDDAAARAEMRDGREHLAGIISAPVALFAYPNGRPGIDYDARHVAMARDLGFTAALSTRRAAADARSDVFELPRFTPWGGDALRFGADFARNYLGYS